ncbi:MAG TPA: hypothetical protein QF604_01700 [Candidatus Latescibacteria bacterium]|jgi:hypothetical protein|nr:hypothetical protein [Gemmatimonadota bacterium]MDP7364574.1 hypothetical protein [Candidatus Latescibacterota bacterium]MDP7633853.1 hypothetical protein [Candidatus Latescibacterota bacterium]HCV22433.1 hypothetical protein [Candidatus Latescibacterota bacterium]HJN26612.1 hypothetical protein [Candidatus Latescibacterota bacterium]
MTTIHIETDRFFIDGTPTYAGCHFREEPIEGLLLNSRMIQATFDDENPETVHRWAYPDSGTWDAARNVIEALPIYRDHGLLAVTLNFQGGSPEGYSKEQPYPPSAGPLRRTHTLRFGVVCGQRSRWRRRSRPLARA